MSFTPVPYGTIKGSGLISLADTNAHQLATNSTREVILTADPANAGTIFVGTDNTVTSSGGGSAFIKLSGGNSLVLQIKNTNMLWVVASGATQKYMYLAEDA